VTIKRALVQPSMPDWRSCASAAARLEDELGIEHSPLRLVGPITHIEVPPDHLVRWMRACALPDVSAVVGEFEKCYADGVDLTAAAVTALGPLMRDNANARGRSVEDSWIAVVDALPDGWDEARSLVLTLKLAKAHADDNQGLVNAMREGLAEGGWEFADLWLWKLMRLTLADTAAARERTVDDLTAQLIAQLSRRASLA
jgi:hypothetical protein